MKSFKTYSPIDNALYVERFFATEKEIRQVLLTAQQAKQNWKMTSLADRARFCTRAVDHLVANKDILAQEISWQMGRPIRYAAAEITGLEERARCMISLAETALAPIQLPQKTGFIRYIQREPLGLVFVIAPWNYPYLTAVNAIIPALMSGNVVLLKHSAQTPLVAERFAEAFRFGGLPEGVFQYLHLTHQQAENILETGPIDHIAFTGSVAAGKRIEEAAAGRFLSIGLELGGKDPAYVRGDADLDYAVATTIDGAFFNSGQSCCGIKRIYVHEDRYDDFLKKSIALAYNYKLGRSDDPATTLGPTVRGSSADFLRAQIQEALDNGAVAHIDKHCFDLDVPGSAYMSPQILTNVTHQMRIMTEESFGPVLGMMKVGSDQEAIDRMNDSAYGLTAAIFTQDTDEGIRIGDQLQTGTVFINRCDYLDPALAWTGVKQSGRGCSLSRIGYESLTRPKSFHIKKIGDL